MKKPILYEVEYYRNVIIKSVEGGESKQKRIECLSVVAHSVESAIEKVKNIDEGYIYSSNVAYKQQIDIL